MNIEIMFARVLVSDCIFMLRVRVNGAGVSKWSSHRAMGHLRGALAHFRGALVQVRYCGHSHSGPFWRGFVVSVL